MKTQFTKIQLGLSLFIAGAIFVSCHKKFLEEKPHSGLVIPSTLENFQRLLDNTSFGTTAMMVDAPDLALVSADDYYVLQSFYDTRTVVYRNAYIWKPDIYEGVGNDINWDLPFQQVFIANIILEGLDKVAITHANQAEWNRIKGSALFFRAYAYFNLSQIYTPPYDAATADTDLGLPLKLTSDVNQIQQRSSVLETYNQILADLNEAKELLHPAIDYINPNRPSKPAALAMLSRVYMSMRDYENAFTASDECLKIHDRLIDFNILNRTSANPFPLVNEELIFYSIVHSSTPFFLSAYNNVIIEPALYDSYQTNDLRKVIYFRPNPTDLPYRKTGYSRRNGEFTGLATDEVLLNRAECLARSGQLVPALNDLNRLSALRYDGTFVPFTAATPQAALQLIQSERRKELIFRGTRWSDIRRLNKEGYNITLTRNINGETYTLPPNDLRYTLLIPFDEVSRSGIQQNPR